MATSAAKSTIPRPVVSAVWQYGTHRISWCDEIFQIFTGCERSSTCIPPAMSLLQWRRDRIPQLATVLRHLEEKLGEDLTPHGIRVVLRTTNPISRDSDMAESTKNLTTELQANLRDHDVTLLGPGEWVSEDRR